MVTVLTPMERRRLFVSSREAGEGREGEGVVAAVFMSKVGRSPSDLRGEGPAQGERSEKVLAPVATKIGTAVASLPISPW